MRIEVVLMNKSDIKDLKIICLFSFFCCLLFAMLYFDYKKIGKVEETKIIHQEKMVIPQKEEIIEITTAGDCTLGSDTNFGYNGEFDWWFKNKAKGDYGYFFAKVKDLFTENEIVDCDNLNLEKIYHQTVKKVTNDYENISFNTAISQLMIFINACYKETILPKKYMEGFLKLFNPVCPHITEELWQQLGNNNSIANSSWPVFDDKLTQEEEYEMVVQVNGKVRGKISVSKSSSKEEMEKIAKEIPNVKVFIDNKEIIKIITVLGKLVNIVVR